MLPLRPSLPILFTLALVFALASPGALAAQGLVQFRFDGDLIQLRVTSGGTAGSVELVDGDPARIRVTERDGDDAFFNLEGDALAIENRSAAPGDYLISVPPTARVVLLVDGRTVLAAAPAEGGRQVSWSWRGEGRGARERAEAAPAREATRPRYRRAGVGQARTATGPRAAPPRPPKHTFSVQAFGGELVVDSVDVWGPESIRSLKIVVGGDRFRVYGNRSVRFGWYDRFRWGVIAPNSDGLEITVELPDDPEIFQVKMGGLLIWRYIAGRGRAFCQPLAELTRRDGRPVWVFTPIDGQLSCTPPAEGPQPA